MSKYDFYSCEKCGGFQRLKKGKFFPCVHCDSKQLTLLSENDALVLKHKKNARTGKIFLSLIFLSVVFIIFITYVNYNYTSIWDMFDSIKGEETYSYSSDYSYNNHNTSSDYKMWKGMNGTYTYRCSRICTESCKYCKSSCINGREDTGPSCTHQYSAKTQIGWIGCPLCGDVDNESWHDWYDSALKKGN